jgi:hypothetical protein
MGPHVSGARHEEAKLDGFSHARLIQGAVGSVEFRMHFRDFHVFRDVLGRMNDFENRG